MKRSWIRAALLAFVVAWSGCALLPSEPPGEAPHIEGVITLVQLDRSPLRVLIEENPAAQEPLEPGGEKIFFSVTGRTSILLQQPDGSTHRGSWRDLREGDRARAWHTGVVLESYPSQANARVILILPPSVP